MSANSPTKGQMGGAPSRVSLAARAYKRHVHRESNATQQRRSARRRLQLDRRRGRVPVVPEADFDMAQPDEWGAMDRWDLPTRQDDMARRSLDTLRMSSPAQAVRLLNANLNAGHGWYNHYATIHPGALPHGIRFDTTPRAGAPRGRYHLG